MSAQVNKIHQTLRASQRKSVFTIAFPKYLDSFTRFGNCAHHPLFRHVEHPPSGYVFDASPPNNSPLQSMRKVLLAVKLAAAFVSLCFSAVWQGAYFRSIMSFVRSRKLSDQLSIPASSKLLFLPSVPYLFGQKKWVIECEDTTSLLFPFVHNGKTSKVDIQKVPEYAIIRSLLLSKRCLGIITHMQSTYRSLPLLFKSEALASKTFYVPPYVPIHEQAINNYNHDKPLRLLFSNSWHQPAANFYLRGGLDTLVAYQTLKNKGANIQLTIRSNIPEDAFIQSLLDNDASITVVDRFLDRDEWSKLQSSHDLYMLPSARIHVVSLLEAMGAGLVSVVSDGWGFDEFVTHRKTGIVAAGRRERVSYIDTESGTLREDYQPMFLPNNEVIESIVREIEWLVQYPGKVNQIKLAASQQVAVNNNITVFNRNLKSALDTMLGVEA